MATLTQHSGHAPGSETAERGPSPSNSTDNPSTHVGASLTGAVRKVGRVGRHARYIGWRLVQGPEERRRVRRLLALRLLQGEAETVSFQRDGVAWTIPVGDRIIAKTLFETGGFQVDELRGLVEWLKTNHPRWAEGDVVLDVGANIGTTCVPLALETDRHVLALEPDPANFDFLYRNVELNELNHRIECHQIAISNQPGTVKMVVDPASSGSTEMWEAGMPQPPNGIFEVQATTLDALLASEGISPERVTLVWSDTQGFERQVIESGVSLWSSGVPLYVEVWLPGLDRHGGLKHLAQTLHVHFERMVGSAELAAEGPLAKARPIEEFEAYIASLSETCSDVLLIPRRTG